MQVWLANLPGHPRAVVVAAAGKAGVEGASGARAAAPAPPPTPPTLPAAPAPQLPPRTATAPPPPPALAFSMAGDRVAVTQLDASAVVWARLRRSVPARGCLGLLPAGGHTFLALVTHAECVGSIVRGAAVWCVRDVAFVCIDSGAWDALPVDAESEHPCAAVRRYLCAGSFFYADGYDLTARVHRPAADLDARFASPYTWNAFLAAPLLEYRARLEPARRAAFDSAQLLVLLVQGFVGVRVLDAACTVSLVSRVSARHAGTRFNARGLDDAGYAAGFAESEVVLARGDAVAALALLRGSVPVFWEQQGLQLGARIQLTRSAAATFPAFARHMHKLLASDARVFVLDLLGTRDAETTLSDAYAAHIRTLLRTWDDADGDGDGDGDDDAPPRGALHYHHFDFHGEARMRGGLGGVRPEFECLNNVQGQRAAFGVTEMHAGRVLRTQGGVFRVNCFDCLDRTNIVQSFLAHAAVREYLGGSSAPDAPRVLAALADLWTANGDALARISTGTGSINSALVRSGRRSLAGALGDAARSANRLYMNNFHDGGKQVALEHLLGTRAAQAAVRLCDPVYEAAERAARARADEYAAVSTLRVFVGTYNVCAQRAAPLDAWLAGVDADIAAVALQEIVPLTAQQMLLSASEAADAWDAHVARALGADYVRLRRESLFGTLLLVLVRADRLGDVRNVEGASKKTGLRGMSGNKGAVAIRMDVRDTSLALVGAHLTSGVAAVEERHAEAAAIAAGLAFSRGRTLAAHDHIVWAGDMNYRIDEPDAAEVRRLAVRAAHGDAGARERLAAHDQLAAGMAAHRVFRGYAEPPLTFAPTYKYDIGTDTYDSSEKQRAPAWTDRIVRCTRAPLHAASESYARTELRLSDHRPVAAVFALDVCDVDAGRRAEVLAEALRAARDEGVGDVGASARLSEALCAPLEGGPKAGRPPLPGRPPAPDRPPAADRPPVPSRTRTATLPSTDAAQWWNAAPLPRPTTRAAHDVGNPFAPPLPPRPPPVPQRP